MRIVKVKTKKHCEELRREWTLTFTNMTLDEDSLDGLTEWVEQYTSYTNKVIYAITGDQINGWYKLSGNNAFSANQNFVCIKQHDLKDYNKIALTRFDVGGRWLKDIISDKLENQLNFKRKAS